MEGEQQPENVEQQQQQQPVLEIVEQQEQQQPMLENVEQQQQPVLENVEQQQQQQQQPVLDNVEQEQQQHQEEEQQQEQQHHQEEEEQQQQQQQHHVQEIVEEEEEEEINLGEAIRVMEAGCASWIVEMEETLVNSHWSVVTGRGKKPPSIYRVPDRIKRGNTEAYRPKLVSMGPLHYGEADLMPMEHHKKEAVLQRIKRYGKPLVEYVASIQKVVDELLGEYDNLDEKWRTEGRDEFVQMMVMDGCFLLESLQRYFDYPTGNPVFSYHGCLTLYTAIQSDIVVMENQLPLLVLYTLLAVERHTALRVAEVNTIVLELSDAGIRFKSSKTQFIHDINFKNGLLSLPVFKAHDDTKKHLLNLLAFEKLYPCTGHEVLSYVCFMDNLVNTGRDVELLRSKGVIKNLLSSRGGSKGEHFPGLVEYVGVTGPAYSFDHYAAAPDAADRAHMVFNNKAEWVKQELWDFFRCQDEHEARADVVATKCYKKLVVDMHYEARI
ncbi:UPF0481 protein At3g47200-like [Miscanthus floridulus]|uniref:UPF0481 protein At3g47200-like n=1 Tax=Miscanthus floridulus TaxID=154761 RepID=UPI00345AA3AA